MSRKRAVAAGKSHADTPTLDSTPSLPEPTAQELSCVTLGVEDWVRYYEYDLYDPVASMTKDELLAYYRDHGPIPCQEMNGQKAPDQVLVSEPEARRRAYYREAHERRRRADFEKRRAEGFPRTRTR